MTRVLVVEDESDLADALVDALVRHGFEVSSVGTLDAARRSMTKPEIVLLDLGLPDGDGLVACGEFASSSPVIVISARGEEVDRVLALELGADDYLSKPFSTRELVARIRAVLRRSNPKATTVVRVADLEIDLDRFELRRGDEPIDLTLKELELMAVLASRPGALVRRRELARLVWGSDLGLVNRTLEVHISSLRQKLGSAPDGRGYIDTVHGGGYRLRSR